MFERTKEATSVPSRSGRRVWALVFVAACLSVISLMTSPPLARGSGGWGDALRTRLNLSPGSGQGADEAAGAGAALRESVVAEGRFAAYPGAEVVVSAETTGPLLRVVAVEGQEIRKGDLIAELAADEVGAALFEAKHKVAELEANIRLSEWHVKRVDLLAGRAAASVQEVEERRHELAATKARRDAAVATVQRLRAQLNKSRVLAPIDGTIVARSAHPGQMVQALTPIVTIADLSRTRVEAEVNEFDGARVRVGAPATVVAEGRRGEHWQAVVEEIPHVVVSRDLRPQDPGRPSDTGVVLVKLKLLQPAHHLKLGQRVEIRIDVAASRHAGVQDQRVASGAPPLPRDP